MLAFALVASRKLLDTVFSNLPFFFFYDHQQLNPYIFLPFHDISRHLVPLNVLLQRSTFSRFFNSYCSAYLCMLGLNVWAADKRWKNLRIFLVSQRGGSLATRESRDNRPVQSESETLPRSLRRVSWNSNTSFWTPKNFFSTRNWYQFISN